MKPYRPNHFLSSLRQVERRIASESPLKETPTDRSLKSGNPNVGFDRNPDEFQFKRRKLCTKSECGTINTSSNEQNEGRGIQCVTLSQCTESSLGSPIIASRAQAFMDAPSYAESEAAGEFLSHSGGQMWMNSSEEQELETWECCLDVGDNEDYSQREIGGFDDIVELCALLKLDGDCLSIPPKSNQVNIMDNPNRPSVEDQVCTFYSKVAQVKGPKSEGEVKALDAWIHHFAERRKEPFRLAHLLIAKAAEHGNLGDVEFPESAQEFLLSHTSSCHKHLECCRGL